MFVKTAYSTAAQDGLQHLEVAAVLTPQSGRLMLRLSGAVGPNRRSGRRLQYARLTLDVGRSPPALRFQAVPTAHPKYLSYLPLSNPYAVMQTYLLAGHFSRWGWGPGVGSWSKRSSSCEATACICMVKELIAALRVSALPLIPSRKLPASVLNIYRLWARYMVPFHRHSEPGSSSERPSTPSAPPSRPGS
ncbi:hypothetical protein BDW22DRAFT_1348921 [Trametopsis cervina]|nr:hypothetical protein BDW22DRAFT_1348921 [Trametopsis cervina]